MEHSWPSAWNMGGTPYRKAAHLSNTPFGRTGDRDERPGLYPCGCRVAKRRQTNRGQLKVPAPYRGNPES